MPGIFTIETTGFTVLEDTFRRVVDELPMLIVTLPHTAAPAIMNSVMEAMLQNTPVDTGSLRDETYWRETDQDESGLHIEVYSDAVNLRTGYFYAQARAYGFVKVDGETWLPPENPVYPVLALEQARGDMLDYATPIAFRETMRLFAPAA